MKAAQAKKTKKIGEFPEMTTDPAVEAKIAAAILKLPEAIERVKVGSTAEANCWPLRDDPKLRNLLRSIATRGQQYPGQMTKDGKRRGGRRRAVCRIALSEQPWDLVDENDETDPINRALDGNAQSRFETPSQRMLIGAKLYALAHKRYKSDPKRCPFSTVPRFTDLALTLRVDESGIRDANKILEASPEFADLIEIGNIKIRKAKEIITDVETANWAEFVKLYSNLPNLIDEAQLTQTPTDEPNAILDGLDLDHARTNLRKRRRQAQEAAEAQKMAEKAAGELLDKKRKTKKRAVKAHAEPTSVSPRPVSPNGVVADEGEWEAGGGEGSGHPKGENASADGGEGGVEPVAIEDDADVGLFKDFLESLAKLRKVLRNHKAPLALVDELKLTLADAEDSRE
jgi:hypothetical protein